MKIPLTTSERLHQRLFLIFSALVVITMPFSIRLNGLSIILLSANWLAEGNFKVKYQMLRRNPYALLFIGLYLLHVIGLLYSENLRQGFSELEKKVAFVVFPVIFTTTPYLDRRLAWKILYCFVSACLVAAVICVFNGLYVYFFHGDSSYLFYHKLGSAVNFDHAIYFSFYIGVAIFTVLIFLQSRWKSLGPRTRTFYIFIIFFFLLFLVLLSSKTLIPTIILLIIFVLGRLLFRGKGIAFNLGVLFVCVATAALVISAFPNIRERFQEGFDDPYDQTSPLLLDDYLYYHFNGVSIRLAIWKISVNIVDRKNAWIWGVGTGDSQDILTETYIEKHIYPGDKTLGIKGFLHYNSHNQFMQFFLMFGAIGLLLFVSIISLLFRAAIRHSDLLLFLMVLFTAFSLTESTLHVQKGIVSFLFFSSLLTGNVLNKGRTSPDHELSI